jgi:hypothetical protein
VVAGQHRFGELAVMGLEDRRLVAEDIESETNARGQAEGVVDNSFHILDRAPVLAKAEADVDVQPRGDLPGVLDEAFQAGVVGVEVIAFILVGEVGLSLGIIVIIGVVGAGVPEAVSHEGSLRFDAELEVMIPGDEILDVLGVAGVDL